MIEQEYRLNLVPGCGETPPIVHVSQYDVGSRTLKFVLHNNGISFSAPSGSTVSCDGTKSDKKGFSYQGTISGNTATIELEKQMTAKEGPVDCQLTIKNGDQVLGTSNFVLQVERGSLNDDTDLSDTDLPIFEQDLESAVQAAQDAKTAAETAQGKAEDAQSAAEAAKTAAESAKTSAESSASQAISSASSAAQSASTAQQYSGNPAKTINGTWWIWNAETQEYEDSGMPSVLSIVKSYPSVSAMEADFANMQENDLVIIATADISDPDNSKLYIRGDTDWIYLSDLSGLAGVGIENIELTSGTHAPGTSDTYTINYTDGTSTTFQVYNGADGTGSGDMAQSVYDPQNRRQDIYEYADTAAAEVAEQIPTNVSELTNDSGYLTSETDPTVPSWAKEAQKPTYTATEVGAIPIISKPTAGNLASVTAGGGVQDSGKKPSDFVDRVIPSTAGNVALLASDGNLQDSGKQFTPAGIGAAPDGYGLGTTQGMDIPTNESGARDLNLATNNGWYYIYNSENYVNFPGSSEGGPNAGYHAMRVDAFRGVTQTIYMGYQTWAGCIAIRHKNFSSSSWGNWCWINPPMTTGISYRTLEIFNGKPVYKMAISCGAMPAENSTKTVSHGVYNIEAIVAYGGYMNAGGDTSLSIPFRNTTTNYCDIGVDYSKVTIVAGSTSLTGYTSSIVWFSYTLTTD